MIHWVILAWRLSGFKIWSTTSGSVSTNLPPSGWVHYNFVLIKRRWRMLQAELGRKIHINRTINNNKWKVLSECVLGKVMHCLGRNRFLTDRMLYSYYFSKCLFNPMIASFWSREKNHVLHMNLLVLNSHRNNYCTQGIWEQTLNNLLKQQRGWKVTAVPAKH